MKNLMIKKVQENEFSAMVKDANAYELFTNKSKVVVDTEKYQDELKESFVPEGHWYDGIYSCVITAGKGKYAVIYNTETERDEVHTTPVKGLLEVVTHEYVGGKEKFKLQDFEWEKGSKWAGRVNLVRYNEYNEPTAFKAEVQTSGYSESSIEFVEGVAKDLLAAVDKAKEVSKYFSSRGLLYEED